LYTKEFVIVENCNKLFGKNAMRFGHCDVLLQIVHPPEINYLFATSLEQTLSKFVNVITKGMHYEAA